MGTATSASIQRAPRLDVRALAALAAVLVAACLGATPAGATPAPATSHPRAAHQTRAGTRERIRSQPAAPASVLLTQPDGKGFNAIPWGTMTFNGYEVGGYTVARDAQHVWRYVAGRNADGSDALSSARPDQGGPPASIAAHLRPAKPAPDLIPDATAKSVHTPNLGNAPTLVILAQFADQNSVGTTAASWASKFFGASGSVADYYNQASYSKFHVVPATETSGTANDGVVGWVTLALNHPTYDNDSGLDAVATAAFTAANTYVNYASYDTNSDGVVGPTELHITIIDAGYETSYGGPDAMCGKNVWGHQTTSFSPPTLDGKTIGALGYTMFGEQHCSTSDNPGHQATIGIMAHEIGHDLNFPDLYDTDYSTAGVGVWSIMSGGSWNNVPGGFQGSTPAGMDPFDRSYQNWVTPTQVSGFAVPVALTDVETTGSVVRVLDNPNGVDWNFSNQSGTGEYFLIENRQQTGYDASLPGCGVLIWHIDETVTSDNTANANEPDRLVSVEEADGLQQLEIDGGGSRGDAGDPYPGSSHNTSFGNATTPNSHLYSGASSNVTVGVPNVACSSTANLTISTTAAPTTGLLRVTTSPAVPSQITVDGAITDTWGLQWVKEAPGSHTVCFTAVAGYTTPACQTISVTVGATTTVTGTFTQRGYLHVSTSPAVASQISVDGVPRDDWGVYTDIAAGSHQVCFGAVVGQTPPGCQTVSVTAGATTNVTGTFTASAATGQTGVGQLRVTTSPAVPSQITVDGTIADTWGLNWLEVAPGSHTVCFSALAGYTTPACQTVSVANGATTTVNGAFTQRGYLKVNTSPAVAGTITINGLPADDWGVFTDLPAGGYTVCFGTVAGHTAPACQTPTVTAGATTTITGTYT